MFNLKKMSFGTIALFLVPSLAFAEDVKDVKSLITYIISILNALIPLLFAIAFIAFIWGIIKYIAAGGSAKMAEARNYIIFGILGMAVMLSVFGLAYLVKNSFFESAPTPIDVQSGNPLLQNPNAGDGYND